MTPKHFLVAKAFAGKIRQRPQCPENYSR